MELIEITEELNASAGEYIYHKPTEQVVLCGAFNRKVDEIRAFANGRLFKDKIENFSKIRLTKKERKSKTTRKRCGGCKR